MSKNDYSKPYSHPRWNDTGLPKTVGEAPSTFEEQRDFIDVLREGGLIDDEEYNKRLKELKEKYNVKD